MLSWPSLVVGLVVGVLTKVVADLLVFRTLSPHLDVEFTRNHLFVAETQNAPTYVRIRVINRGYRTAKNCRGFLLRIERLSENNVYEPVNGGEECLALIWSNSVLQDRMRGFDLAPKSARFLDIFSVHDHDPSWLPEVIPSEPDTTPNLPNRLVPELNVQGKWRLTIQVCADETDPAVIALTFDWVGLATSLNVSRDYHVSPPQW